MRKGLLLILALLLPVMIFSFLHFFGSNKFEVPIYYQSNPPVLEGCDIKYSTPYRVQDSYVNINGEGVVFFAGGLDQDAFDNYWFQLNRISNELKHSLPVIAVSNNHSLAGSNMLQVLGNGQYEKEKRCVWLSDQYRLVLVDGEMQIRGYYKDGSLKEVDRLILESKILFNEY